MSDKKKQVLAFDFGGGSGRAILGTLENGKSIWKKFIVFPMIR